MSEIDDEFLDGIDEIVAEGVGQTATWTRKTQTGGNAYQPGSGRATNDPNAGIPVTILGLEPVSFSQIQRGLAVLGMTQCLLPARGLSFTPQLSDHLAVQGKTFVVHQLEQLAPTGAVLAYIVILRSA